MSEHDYDTDNAAAGDSLIAVLDEITEIVGAARGVPMSASAMINRSEVLDLLATARDIVPDQIETADAIIGEASEVKADAQRRAKTILERAHADSEEAIKQARQKAARLVSEHEITRGAEERAREILADARLQSNKMNAGADRYSDDSLAFLQNELESLLSKVQAGRHELSRREETRREREQQVEASIADASEQAETDPAHVGAEPEPIVQPFDSVNETQPEEGIAGDGFEPPFDSER